MMMTTSERGCGMIRFAAPSFGAPFGINAYEEQIERSGGKMGNEFSSLLHIFPFVASGAI